MKSRLAILAAAVVCVYVACDTTGPAIDDACEDGTQVTLVPASSEILLLNDSMQLAASVRDRAGRTIADAPLDWRSSTNQVATVSANGQVLARGLGQTWIVARCGSATDSLRLTVEELGVTILPDTAKVTQGGTFQLTATGPKAAAVEWRSEDTTIAVAYNTGLISARSPGSTIIEAKASAAPAHVDGAVLLVFNDVTPNISAAVEAFTLPRTRNVVATNSLSGVVDTHLRLKTAIGSHTVRLRMANVNVTSIDYGGGLGWRIVPFNTSVFLNGSHELSVEIWNADGSRLGVFPVQITIRN